MINISNLFVTVNKGSLHEKMILKQINLSIKDGELVVLGGNNGSGKSVLFNILCGNLKHDIGIVSLDLCQDGDYDTDIEYIRSDINYSIACTETFIENIFLNQLNKKSTFGFINRKSAYAEIEKYIKSFEFGEDIDKMLYKSFKELPKHYEHILVLLIAAVNKPRLMLIDDIFSGLDETETKSILDIITKIHSKQKNTLIISTCNPYTAAKLHGRKVILCNGSIVKDTGTDQIMDHKEVVDLFNQHLKFAYEKDCVLISSGTSGNSDRNGDTADASNSSAEKVHNKKDCNFSDNKITVCSHKRKYGANLDKSDDFGDNVPKCDSVANSESNDEKINNYVSELGSNKANEDLHEKSNKKEKQGKGKQKTRSRKVIDKKL